MPGLVDFFRCVKGSVDAVRYDMNIRTGTSRQQLLPFSLAGDRVRDAAAKQAVFGALDQFRRSPCRDFLRPVPRGLAEAPHHLGFNVVPVDNDRGRAGRVLNDWQVLHQMHPFDLYRVKRAGSHHIRKLRSRLWRPTIENSKWDRSREAFYDFGCSVYAIFLKSDYARKARVSRRRMVFFPPTAHFNKCDRFAHRQPARQLVVTQACSGIQGPNLMRGEVKYSHVTGDLLNENESRFRE